MTIKSFDDYFKENGNRVYNDRLDKKVYVDKKDLDRAKVIFEEFRTPKGVHLWHDNHYQGSEEEQKAVDEFDKKHFKYSLTGSELSAIRDAAVEYASYYEKEKAIGEIKDQIHKKTEEERIVQLVETQNKELNNSKLAKVRRKLAKKLGIKTELPKAIKKVEKAVSDKLLGKIHE